MNVVSNCLEFVGGSKCSVKYKGKPTFCTGFTSRGIYDPMKTAVLDGFLVLMIVESFYRRYQV